MIKLLIGGSPCTHWSIAQKNGRETKPEGLGWELFKNYLIAKEKFKPDLFLYENNKSASEAIKSQIRTELGVWDGTFFTEDKGARYIEINSAFVSAQNRQRFYVHNCGEVVQPEDRGILLRDIIEGDGADGKTGLYPVPINETADGKSQTIKAQYHFTSVQNICCYSSTYGASGVAIPTEEKPQAFDGDEKDPMAMKRVYEVKDGFITIKGKQYPIKLPDGYYNIRKLTVTECCRLQTMPDDYCRAVSDTQAYKGLGNGWTAEVIIHILSKALENVSRDEEIVVLSMYDGIGTGRYCLDKMGFTNIKYYAYEIDEYAKKIALSNYQDIIQMGDAFQVREEDWSL